MVSHILSGDSSCSNDWCQPSSWRERTHADNEKCKLPSLWLLTRCPALLDCISSISAADMESGGAEHPGLRSDVGHHSIFRGGASTCGPDLEDQRRPASVCLLRGWCGHELLLLCVARGHISHIVLGHWERLQSADHPDQSGHLGQALK